MTDTAPLTIDALAAEWGDLNLQGEEEIPAAGLTELREVWRLLLGEGEYVAADWLAAQVNARGSAERFDRFADGLGPLAADGGHLTTICEDGPWTVVCESCGDHNSGDAPSDLLLGRDYPTVAAAKEAAARHVEEAGALRSI